MTIAKAPKVIEKLIQILDDNANINDIDVGHMHGDYSYQIMSRAMLALGNIAADSTVYRDFALNYGALSKIIAVQEQFLKMIDCASVNVNVNVNSDTEEEEKGNVHGNHNSNHNLVNCPVMSYLDDTTWTIKSLFYCEPHPKLTFGIKVIYPLADVLFHIIANGHLTQLAIDYNHNCNHNYDTNYDLNGENTHNTDDSQSDQSLTLKMTIVTNIFLTIKYILEVATSLSNEENDPDDDNINSDLPLKSKIFELVKQSKILQYIIQLTSDAQLTDNARYIALRCFFECSGSDEWVEYMLHLGILDTLAVCIDNKPLGCACSNNEHNGKLKCLDCKILMFACAILKNITCCQGQKLLQLIEHKQLDIRKRFVTLLMRKYNKVVIQCIHGIQNIIRTPPEDEMFDCQEQVAYFVDETNIIPALCQLLDSANYTILELTIDTIDDILSVGKNEKYKKMIFNAGILEKVLCSIFSAIGIILEYLIEL